MPKGTYRIGGFCVVDGKPISQERLSKGSVTCSRECYDTRRKAQRAQEDDHDCRYCRKPSTPEQREAYRLFRRLETKWPGFIENITTAQFNKLKAEWEAVPREVSKETLERVAAINAAVAPEEEPQAEEIEVTWK